MRNEAVIPVCLFTGLSCISVILRLYARLFLVGGLKADDYLITASFVSVIHSFANMATYFLMRMTMTDDITWTLYIPLDM